jgi:hypothetical protein
MDKVGCIIIFAILACFVEAWVFQWLWNELVPLFWATAPILTFWQSLGVCVILSLIGSKFTVK